MRESRNCPPPLLLANKFKLFSELRLYAFSDSVTLATRNCVTIVTSACLSNGEKEGRENVKLPIRYKYNKYTLM